MKKLLSIILIASISISFLVNFHCFAEESSQKIQEAKIEQAISQQIKPEYLSIAQSDVMLDFEKIIPNKDSKTTISEDTSLIDKIRAKLKSIQPENLLTLLLYLSSLYFVFYKHIHTKSPISL